MVALMRATMLAVVLMGCSSADPDALAPVGVSADAGVEDVVVTEADVVVEATVEASPDGPSECVPGCETVYPSELAPKCSSRATEAECGQPAVGWVTSAPACGETELWLDQCVWLPGEGGPCIPGSWRLLRQACA